MAKKGNPSGWYENPDGPGQKWWSGTNWTGATRLDGPLTDPAKSGLNAPVGGGFALLVVAVMAVVFAWSAWGPENKDDDKLTAEVSCQQAVERELKAPSTASFTRLRMIEAGPDGYLVSGTVDAENSFGGTVRMSWGCETRRSESGNWSAEVSVSE